MERINNMSAKITVDGKIWLRIGNETILGHGKITLLEKIKELGTLYASAESIQIPYRQAFAYVTKMNSLAKTPLIIFKRGGKGGGGLFYAHRNRRKYYYDVQAISERF